MVKHHLWKLIVAIALAVILVAPGVSATPLVFQSPPPVPPPNDNFASATVITSLPFSDTAVLAGATTEASEPQYCSGTQQTVWYSYTPSMNQAVKVTWSGFSDANLVIYQAYGPNITDLNEINCTSWNPFLSLTFSANAGTTYYFQVGSIYGNGQTGHLTVETVPPPANDNFADAKVITSLPYSDNTDMTSATSELGEPTPSCGYLYKTIWYAYTPAEGGSLSQQNFGQGNSVVAVYTGSSLNALQQVTCRFRSWYDPSYLSFPVTAGMTYYFQVGTDSNASVSFNLQVTPPPIANYSYSPYDPSSFDTVNFWDNSSDPVNVGIQSQAWKFGDGATASGYNVTHRYAADGDYNVTLTVTTYDGRTAATTQPIHVKTHDVAITKFTVPQSASSGQTRQLVVGLNSKRYVDEVEVQLFKGAVGGGWQLIGTLRQTVPVRSANRTTDFQFSYTFTKDDAALGKVTFRTVANVVNGRDALPADNESIALPTKVTK